MQKIKNIHGVDSEKNVTDRLTDRQTVRQADGLMNRTNFIGTLLQKWRFDHIFLEIEE